MKAGFGWLKIAAEGGNVAAQNRLAKCYRDGLGTEADKIEAAAWYVLARRAGLSDPGMDIFFSGLADDDQKKAIERANKLQ
jgi:TPR repeat protein